MYRVTDLFIYQLTSMLFGVTFILSVLTLFEGHRLIYSISECFRENDMVK